MPRRLTVYYDGQCDLCIRARNLARKLDWRSRVTWNDFRQPSVAYSLDEQDRQRLKDELLAIDSKGNRFWGFEGWRQIAKVLPPLFPAGVISGLPGVRNIGRGVYGWVSRHRCPECDSSQAHCETR